MMRPSTVLLCLFLAQFLFEADAVAADIPLPPGSVLSGQVTKGGFDVVVYTVELSNEKTVAYLELWKRGARIEKLRVTPEIGEKSDYNLKVVDLKDGHSVVWFRSTAKSEDLGRDGYLAVFSGSAPHTVIYSGSVDAFEPKVRVGIDDIDGDGDDEVVLAQFDAGVLFCGQSHSALFPQIWDFNKKHFVRVPFSSHFAKGAPEIEAAFSNDAPMATHFPELIGFRAASSDYRDSMARVPTELADANVNTAWIEGSRGWGKGEFVTANVNRSFEMKGVRILPGHAASLGTFSRHGVPEKVLLTFEDGSALKVKLPKAPLIHLKEKGGLYVSFPKPIRSRCVTLTLLEVRSSSKKIPEQRTAITEFTPLISLDYVSREDAVTRLIKELTEETEVRRRRELLSLARGLGDELTQGLAKVISEELSSGSTSSRLNRLIPLLGLLPVESGFPLLSKLLHHEGLSKSQLALIQKMISFKGRVHIRSLIQLAVANQTPPMVKARAVRIFSRAGTPAQMVELVPLLGEGDGDLRRSVVRGLSRAPISVAGALLDAVDAHPDSGVCHDALWALDRLSKNHLRGSIGHIDGSERIIRAYNATNDAQTRLRALRLLTRVTPPNADVFLITVLDSNERSEIRSVAAKALRIHTSDKTTRALVRALQDPSPDVRYHAIKSLGTRPNLPIVISATITYLERERWKRGLKLAFLILAKGEQLEGTDALYQAIESGGPTSLMALSALVQSKQNIRSGPLSKIVRDDTRTLRARRKALQALTFGAGPATEEILIESLLSSDHPEELSVAAARAMGIKRTAKTAEALIAVVAETNQPHLRRACIRSLAFYASNNALVVLKGLRSSVDLRTRKYLEKSIASIEDKIRGGR